MNILKSCHFCQGSNTHYWLQWEDKTQKRFSFPFFKYFIFNLQVFVLNTKSLYKLYWNSLKNNFFTTGEFFRRYFVCLISQNRKPVEVSLIFQIFLANSYKAERKSVFVLSHTLKKICQRLFHILWKISVQLWSTRQ